MNRLFGAERAEENQRLGAKVGESSSVRSERSLPQAEGSAVTQLSAAGTPRPLKRSRIGGAVIVGAAALGLGAVFWGGRRGPEPSGIPAAPSDPPAASAISTDTRRTVAVKIDPRATLALVSGTRHDERPLLLKLGPGEAVSVEVTAPNGAVVRRTVRSHDDGILIALDPPLGAPAASAKTAPRRASSPKSRTSGENPLLKNPF
jgi:hypothetical protein